MSPRFSERSGAVAVSIQVRTMDESLRSSIWNLIQTAIPGDPYSGQYAFVQNIAIYAIRTPVDHIPIYSRQWLFQTFMGLPWERAYDVLEYVADHPGPVPPPRMPEAVAQFKHLANLTLEREHAGYRFVNGVLTEIAAPVEIEEITRAVERAREAGLDGVHLHITSALEQLGKRPEPDYRNAIREAITSVESAAKLIGGERKGGLDPALDALSQRMHIHSAMKAGFLKLYGFTSDDSGIRHALLDETPTADAADARFMIVACSAFVNWLIVKADAASLLDR